MNKYKKILVLFISLIYCFFIFEYPDSMFFKVSIPLFTTIISLVICPKSEKFNFTISLRRKSESKIEIILFVCNTTIDFYHINRIKIGKLPEEIMKGEIISPNSSKNIEMSINGNLPPKSQNIKGNLYVTINANSKVKKYLKRKILNPHYELTATKFYKFRKTIREVFKS